MPAATVGCVHTDPGRIRSGPGGWPAKSPACTVSPVEFSWGTLCGWAGLSPHPCPQQARGLFVKGASGPVTPDAGGGGAGGHLLGPSAPLYRWKKPRAGLGRGSPRVHGSQRMTLAGVGSGFLVGRRVQLKAYGGLCPHRTGGGSKLAQQPGGLCRWAEGWGETVAWVGRAESS